MRRGRLWATNNAPRRLEFLDVRGDGDHHERGVKTAQSGSREIDGGVGDRTADPGQDGSTDWGHRSGTVSVRIIRALRNGNDNVAVLGSVADERAAYALGKLARRFLAPGTDANTTCKAAAVQAYVRAFRGDARRRRATTSRRRDPYVIWGANPKIAHPVLYRRQPWRRRGRRRPDRRRPRRKQTAADADLHAARSRGRIWRWRSRARAGRRRQPRRPRSSSNTTPRVPRPLVGSLPDVETSGGSRPPETGRERVLELAAAFDDADLVYWGIGQPERFRDRNRPPADQLAQ